MRFLAFVSTARSASAMSTTLASKPCFCASFLVRMARLRRCRSRSHREPSAPARGLAAAAACGWRAAEPARPRNRRRSRRARRAAAASCARRRCSDASMSSGVNGAFFGSNGWAVTNASSTFFVSRGRELPPSVRRFILDARHGATLALRLRPRGRLASVYLDLVGPRQPGARPSRGRRKLRRARECPCRRWRCANDDRSVATARSFGQRAVLDDDHRRLRRGAGREQLVAEMLRRAHAHVDGKSLARLRQRRPIEIRRPVGRAPVTTANWRTLVRSVTGRPTLAAQACAAVMPGTTSTGMPAARTAAISSAARPNTKASPPLRRATRGPSAPRARGCG